MHLRRIELTNFRQHRKLDVDFSGNMIAIIGHNGCLAEGTPVRLFDGSIKPVEQIKEGDALLAFDDSTGRLTSSTVFDMIRTRPNQKPKPMLEVTINGEKTCTTYDHPFFAGDGFYPLYQLVWGALEECQRSQLKLLCEQYGAPFDDETIWQQNSCCDEACARREWILQDNAEWAYREVASSSGGGMAGKSAWTHMREPYRLQSCEQQDGESGVVQPKIQCVVWGNPWQHQDPETADTNSGGDRDSSKDVEGETHEIPVQGQRTYTKTDHISGDTAGVSSGQEDVRKEHYKCGLRIEVLEAAPYYTIRMREAPYTYCIGRRNCYLTHNCGKSNLIGAIQYALTGEQPGFTKADLATWGEKEGSVRLFFTAGSANQEFVVTRKTNGDVTLKIGDETIKQARKVEEALRDRAGLDKELIRQIVFVPQKGIDAILFDDPKNREVAFQRLIGIGNASKIYETLRTEIAAYDKPQGFDEAIARARVQLGEQEELAKKCREALGRYEDAVKKLPAKETLEKEIDELAATQVAADEMVNVSRRLESAQDELERVQKALSETGVASSENEEILRNEASELSAKITEIQKELNTHKETVRYLERLKELRDAFVSAKESAASANSVLENLLGRYGTSLEDDKALVDDLKSAWMADVAEYNSLKKMMDAASSDGTCPVCGAPATQEDISKHLSDRILEASKKESETKAKYVAASGNFELRQKEETAARSALKNAEFVKESATNALLKAKNSNVEGIVVDTETNNVSYKGRTPDDIASVKDEIEGRTAEAEKFSKRINEVNDELARIARTASAAKAARDNVSRLTAQVDMLIQSKQTAAKRLADMHIDPDTVGVDGADSRRKATEEARKNLDAYNGILRDMAAEKGRLEQAEKTIESTKRFIDELVGKKVLEDKVKEKVDTLKRVREWFHYKEGPRIMSQNVMRDLTACVNSYLDQFCAPFVVEAEEEGFGFRCRFIDGRTMPNPHPDASLLSGGQKVALAIAFRMAIYMCFGGELGLLSLDEPTAYLDDANIEHLGELLQKVGEVARNKGLQILMATHEKGIMPFLDTKIDLNELVKKEG